MQLHVTKKFGAHLHVYLITLVEYYYQLARELNELEMLTTQPWLIVKFSQVENQFLEPNRNLELRNPAAAYTDCLLQYKEAAQFIGFMEMEDLLFPSNANTYYEEFEREYEGSFMISALYYQVLEQQSEKCKTFSLFPYSPSIYSQWSISTKSWSISRKRQLNWSIKVRKSRGETRKIQFHVDTLLHTSWQTTDSSDETTRRTTLHESERSQDECSVEFQKDGNSECCEENAVDVLDVQVVNGTESGSIPLNPISSDQKMLSEAQLTEIDEDIQKWDSLVPFCEYPSPSELCASQLSKKSSSVSPQKTTTHRLLMNALPSSNTEKINVWTPEDAP